MHQILNDACLALRLFLIYSNSSAIFLIRFKVEHILQ